MKIKELDNLISEVLEQETKKIIKEQIDDADHLIDSVKSFQSLSGLLDKINEIEDAGINNTVIFIRIVNVTPEELVDCCGGSSLEEAQKNLMQGLHHDLEDNGFGDDFDVDIDTSGDESALQLVIRISPNDDKSLTDTKEQTKDTNPTIDDKKNVILGSKEVDEQTGMLTAAFLAPIVAKAGQVVADKVADKLGVNSEEEVDESKKDKKWIQKAIKPGHEGYCTPMTKETCTPKRKALAKTLKKMAKNESTQKRIITLNEEGMTALLNKILYEAVSPSGIGNVSNAPTNVAPGGVPGIDVTKKSHKDSGKENYDALKAIEKKIKDYLSFEGNDNPEFPNQIGQGEDKVGTKNTPEEDEVVNINRGRGPQDLDYDQEPSKRFKERLKMSLIGDTKTGNSQDAVNVIKTKTGEKISKTMEDRKKAKSEEPIYEKEQVPISDSDKKTTVRKPDEDKAISSEILRMKQMSEYKEKTQ